MKSKKIIGLVLAAVLLVGATVAGTMAYLTSTDKVENTFTAGNVKLVLDEAKVDEKGKALEGEAAERVKGNAYHLLPGHEYDKDPTVHVKVGSEDCYVRMIVTVSCDNSLTESFGEIRNLETIFEGRNESNWNLKKQNVSADGKTATYEYWYADTVPKVTAGEDETLPALFTRIKMPDGLTNVQLAKLSGFKIDIVAHAIQVDGFESAEAAWAAFPEGAVEP